MLIIIGYNIFSIAKILFVSKANTLICIARDFEPPPPKQNSARKRAEFSEFPRKTNTNSVGGALRRPLLSSFRTDWFRIGVFTIPS
ncbi:TPA: hypothetical protein DCZ09_03380 [Candidatus Nomurabacteria bacterium]|nr:hypothetical protein [Candidatus Nomurabacteria bacterium]